MFVIALLAPVSKILTRNGNGK